MDRELLGMGRKKSLIERLSGFGVRRACLWGCKEARGLVSSEGRSVEGTEGCDVVLWTGFESNALIERFLGLRTRDVWFSGYNGYRDGLSIEICFSFCNAGCIESFDVRFE